MAVRLAWPLAPIVAVLGSEGHAGAADAVAVKLTTPPSTGSTGLLAVTVTASGLANAVPTMRRLRRAAGDGRDREALALEGADVDGAARGRPRCRAVGSAWAADAVDVPASIAGLPGSRAMVWVGPP